MPVRRYCGFSFYMQLLMAGKDMLQCKERAARSTFFKNTYKLFPIPYCLKKTQTNLDLLLIFKDKGNQTYDTEV